MDATTHAAGTDAQSLDVIYSLLSDQRRRGVIAAIAELDPPIGLSEFATAVTETGAESNELAERPIDEVICTLHHIHLPKLDDSGVIDYDARRHTVTSAQIAPLRPFLDGPPDRH